VSELRGEKIDIIPFNEEPARFVAKALSPARVREVLVDDEAKQATVIVPDDQLSLAIGKDGLNARLAARLTGWRVDIRSETEFAEEEHEMGFEEEELAGRCAAILANGKRCPNASLPGSRYCAIPSHQELEEKDTDFVVPPEDEGGDGAVPEEEAAEAQPAEVAAEAGPAAEEAGVPAPDEAAEGAAEAPAEETPASEEAAGVPAPEEAAAEEAAGVPAAEEAAAEEAAGVPAPEEAVDESPAEQPVEEPPVEEPPVEEPASEPVGGAPAEPAKPEAAAPAEPEEVVGGAPEESAEPEAAAPASAGAAEEDRES
jgi:transcription termination/antitermination protein NusA